MSADTTNTGSRMPEFEKITIVGADAFATALATALEATGASVARVSSPAADPEAVGEADLIIEAEEDDALFVRAAFRELGSLARREAVIVTTAPAVSVTAVAAELPAPERAAGLHFLHRTLAGDAVEVVRAEHTSERVITLLGGLVENIGKVAVHVKDRPGFLLNRLLVPYLNDVVQALDDGLASAEDLDVALRLGLGYKRGPLEMLDAIGLAAHQQTTTALFEALADPLYATPPLLRAMTAAGRTSFHHTKDES